MRIARIAFIAALIFGFGAHAIADIPFLWLDAPKGRDNKFDPKSPLFVPTNTPGAPAPVGTNTFTGTSTMTPTPTPTFTPVIDSKDPVDNNAGGATALVASAVLAPAQFDNTHRIGDATDTADYYAMTLTLGQQYVFTAVRTGGTGSVDIEIRNNPGDTLLQGPVSSTGDAAITLLSAASTTVYVVVRRTGGVVDYNFSYKNDTGAPTPTPTFTFSNTPVNTATFTYTETSATTPTFTVTSTPTPTTAVVAGALVTDFEDNANNDKTLWETGAVSVYTGVDAFGSTMTQDPWNATAAVAPGAGNTSNFAACIDGSLQPDGPPNYPFAAFTMELVSTGGQTDGLGAGVDVTAVSPNNGIQIKYKATVANIPYRLILIQSGITDYAHWKYDFTPTDTNWHTLDVYFPGSGSVPAFVAPYGAWTFDKTMLGGISIYPLPTGATHAYGICIDDVTFAAAPYVPAGHTALVTDFEDNAANDHTLWDTSPGTMFTSVDAFGSTITQNPWTISSGVAPGAGNSSNFAGCIDGSLQLDGPPNYPFAQILMELVSGGSLGAGGGPSVDITSYVTNNGLQFKYKATVANVPYRVALIQSTVTDYGHYAYVFTPTDTNWHTLNVYFPGSGGSPAFSKPYGTTPFDRTQIGAVTVYPLPTGATHAYGICIDDVTFAADPIPTPTATVTVGSTTMIADWETPGSQDFGVGPFSTAEIITSIDAFGTTMTQNPWSTNSATAGGAYGTSSYAACIDGTQAPDGPPNYPFAQLVVGVVAGGTDSSGTGPTTDITAYAPGNSVSFDYQASVAGGTNYRITMMVGGVTDYAHYQYIFVPPDTNWHTETVYFPGAGTPEFARPGWASQGTPPFDKTMIGGFQFYAIPGVAAAPYGICIDNLKFQ